MPDCQTQQGQLDQLHSNECTGETQREPAFSWHHQCHQQKKIRDSHSLDSSYRLLCLLLWNDCQRGFEDPDYVQKEILIELGWTLLRLWNWCHGNMGHKSSSGISHQEAKVYMKDCMNGMDSYTQNKPQSMRLFWSTRFYSWTYPFMCVVALYIPIRNKILVSSRFYHCDWTVWCWCIYHEKLGIMCNQPYERSRRKNAGR